MLCAQMQEEKAQETKGLVHKANWKHEESKCFSAQDCLLQGHYEALRLKVLFCKREAGLADQELVEDLGRAGNKTADALNRFI